MKLTSLNFVRVHVCTSLSLDDSIPLANAVTVSVSSTGCRKPISAEPSSFHATQAILAVALQPARQLHTSEVCHTDSSARQSTDHAVHQSAESQVSSYTRPTTWKLGGGIPPHTELQRQGIANNDPRGRLAPPLFLLAPTSEAELGATFFWHLSRRIAGRQQRSPQRDQ